MTDIICLPCYKGFHKILENPLSLDSNLEELIHSLEAELATSQITAVNVSVDQSILNVTLVVATHLLRNEAILLSDAYDIFTQSITESSTLPQITPNATLSKRAFHKHLISSLQEHLECRTVEQSVGIILYRKGGDTLNSLSKSLAKQRHARVIHAHKPTPTTDPNKPMCTTDTTNQTRC